METTTPFDLNRAIQQWRENLGQSPAFRSENLYELETHLRDSIGLLKKHTLSDEEAFVIATKRIGAANVIDAEYSKMSSHRVWLDRFVWAAIGFQAWITVSAVYSSFKSVALSFTSLMVMLNPALTEPTFLKLRAWLPVICIALFSALAITACWRFSRSLKHVTALKLAVVFFSICVGARILADAVLWYVPAFATGRFSLLDWRLVAASFSRLVIPLALLLLIVELSRRRSAIVNA